jgi:hypothetical protein
MRGRRWSETLVARERSEGAVGAVSANGESVEQEIVLEFATSRGQVTDKCRAVAGTL